MKKSFSLIELIIVIVIVAILYSSINFTLSNTSLNQAADKLINHINYTRHLAIKDNKMQYYPINGSIIEMNRSKYWFKQWWQLRISKTSNGDYFYEIFSDSPTNSDSTNFNKIGSHINEFAIDPYNNLYMDGNYNNPNKKLNLSYYNIKKILYNGNIFSSSIRIIFDGYGNCYISEGDKGDNGDINPYNIIKREPLLDVAKITLCQDDNCETNISLCISPKIGNTYLCN